MKTFLHKHRHLIALALIGGVAFVFVYSRLIYAPCDDAYIFLVFAKNWLAGNGPTFNGAVVEGFSSPLWLGLLTLIGLTRIPLPIVMQILSTLSGFLALYAAYRLAVTLSDSKDWALLAPLLLAATGDFAFYMGVGLEEVLFAALLTLAADELLKDAAGSLSSLKLPAILASQHLRPPRRRPVCRPISSLGADLHPQTVAHCPHRPVADRLPRPGDGRQTALLRLLAAEYLLRQSQRRTGQSA